MSLIPHTWITIINPFGGRVLEVARRFEALHLRVIFAQPGTVAAGYENAGRPMHAFVVVGDQAAYVQQNFRLQPGESLAVGGCNGHLYRGQLPQWVAERGKHPAIGRWETPPQ